MTRNPKTMIWLAAIALMLTRATFASAAAEAPKDDASILNVINDMGYDYIGGTSYKILYSSSGESKRSGRMEQDIPVGVVSYVPADLDGDGEEELVLIRLEEADEASDDIALAFTICENQDGSWVEAQSILKVPAYGYGWEEYIALAASRIPCFMIYLVPVEDEIHIVVNDISHDAPFFSNKNSYNTMVEIRYTQEGTFAASCESSMGFYPEGGEKFFSQLLEDTWCSGILISKIYVPEFYYSGGQFNYEKYDTCDEWSLETPSGEDIQATLVMSDYKEILEAEMEEEAGSDTLYPGYSTDAEDDESTILFTGTDEDVVATIDDERYATLNAAVRSVKDGQTILIQNNIDIGNGILLYRDVSYTIDLNGYQLTTSTSLEDTSFNISGGNVTLKNGTLDLAIGVWNEANVTLSDVEKISWGTFQPDIQIHKDATLTIEGGSYNSLQNDGLVVINDGVFEGELLNNETGVLIIENATVKGEDAHIYNQGGKMIIKDGDFSGKSSLLDCANGSITEISGGTFTCTSEYGIYFFNIDHSRMDLSGGNIIYPSEDYCAAVGVIGESAYLNMTGGRIQAWGEEGVLVGMGRLDMKGGSIEAYGPETYALRIALDSKAVITGGTLYSDKSYPVYTYKMNTFERQGGDISSGNSDLEDIFVYYK